MEKDKDTLKREAEDAKAALDALVHEKVRNLNNIPLSFSWIKLIHYILSIILKQVSDI